MNGTDMGRKNCFVCCYTFLFNKLLHLSLVIECAFGQYGKNCSDTCGHCSNVSQCSNVDGDCQSGCTSGYHGRYCKKGKAVLKRIIFSNVKFDLNYKFVYA